MLTKITILAGLLTAALALAGCAHQPSPMEISTADYGSYPNNYQDVVKSYVRQLLRDPESAQYEHWIGPSRGYVGGNFVATTFGYRVCVDVNAKNGFGGYVGFETNYFMIHNGSVVQYFQSYDAKKLCESM